MMLPFERYVWGAALVAVGAFAALQWGNAVDADATASKLAEQNVQCNVNSSINSASLTVERSLRTTVAGELAQCVARWDAHTVSTAALLAESAREAANAKREAANWQRKWDSLGDNCKEALNVMGLACSAELSDY